MLIEAQLAGVGVVSTPAGGAAEAFLPGRTGVLLSSATNPDLAELCTAVDVVLSWKGRSSFWQKWMQRFAAEQFSVQTMVGHMAALLSGGHVHDPAAAPASAGTVALHPRRSTLSASSHLR